MKASMREALQACLEMQHAALAEFVQTLDDEASCMEQGRFSPLAALVERKSTLARQVAELDRERRSLQAQAHFDPAGAPQAGEEALREAWGRLEIQARAARQANQRNGAMVHTLLDFTRQAVALMQGGQRPLYGSDGRHPGGAQAAPGKVLSRG